MAMIMVKRPFRLVLGWIAIRECIIGFAREGGSSFGVESRIKPTLRRKRTTDDGVEVEMTALRTRTG